MTNQEMQDHLGALYFAYRALAEALETHGVLDSQRLQARLRIGADGLHKRGMREAVHGHVIGLADQILLDSFHRRGFSPEEALQRLHESQMSEEDEAPKA